MYSKNILNTSVKSIVFSCRHRQHFSIVTITNICSFVYHGIVPLVYKKIFCKIALDVTDSYSGYTTVKEHKNMLWILLLPWLISHFYCMF